MSLQTIVLWYRLRQIKIRFNRLIGCKLFGHRKIGSMYDYDRNKDRFKCFSCYKELDLKEVMLASKKFREVK